MNTIASKNKARMHTGINMKKTSLALLAAVMLSSCITTGTSPNQGGNNANLKNGVNALPDSPLKDIIGGAVEATGSWSPEQEHQLGREMAAQLLGAKPLYKNDAAQKYLNEVGLWIALQTEQPQLAWHFGIIDTPNVNAFAAPGGYVFITRGLLLRIKNESELAGVLAHEITHVLKKHHVQAMKMQGLGKLAKGVVESKTGQNAQISNLAKGLYTSGLDKSDEYEADRIGVVLAARAGYSPFGLPAVLQMYAASSAQDASLELLFATHPAAADRLNKLDLLMTTNQLDNYNDGLSRTARFEKIQKMSAFQEDVKAQEPKPSTLKKSKKKK